jgi:hypothetical protein
MPEDPGDYEVDPDKIWGKGNGADAEWDAPDMSVLNQRRRPPPRFLIDVFRDWGQWVTDGATNSACPGDYVGLPLLALASALIGNARWAQATPAWMEPPVLWPVSVGDSGDSKSPGSDCVLVYVLPELEARMLGDFVERLDEYRQAVIIDKLAEKEWEKEVKAAQQNKQPIPKRPPRVAAEIEPQRPRLLVTDITVEQAAMLCATAAQKGLLIHRDELAGWFGSMNQYHAAGRQFWIESYGGRFYRVERRAHSAAPIEVRHLSIAATGGAQPEKLADLIAGSPDDGLLSRVQWGWPDPIEFKLGREPPGVNLAIERLDLLRQLEMKDGAPIYVPLTERGQQLIEQFGREIQARQRDVGGYLRSAYGKARGTALRLSLVLEELWWCASGDMTKPPPSTISPEAFIAAAALVEDYFLPMAERVYGDAAATELERNAATLARWIVKEHPPEVHVRHLERVVRLPGLRTAETIKKAANALVDAGWLRAQPVGFGVDRKVSYLINPRIFGG